MWLTWLPQQSGSAFYGPWASRNRVRVLILQRLSRTCCSLPETTCDRERALTLCVVTTTYKEQATSDRCPTICRAISQLTTAKCVRVLKQPGTLRCLRQKDSTITKWWMQFRRAS